MAPYLVFYGADSYELSWDITSHGRLIRFVICSVADLTSLLICRPIICSVRYSVLVKVGTTIIMHFQLQRVTGWWQLDVSWLTILLMQKLGLAWNVKVPTQQSMAAKKRA